MAAPDHVSLRNLTGKWRMSKTLSSETEPLLAHQGVPWLLRKAISVANVTLTIKQYLSPEDHHMHIDIDNIISGTGMKGSTECRVMDWEQYSHSDYIFGSMKGRSRWCGGVQETEETSASTGTAASAGTAAAAPTIIGIISGGHDLPTVQSACGTSEKLDPYLYEGWLETGPDLGVGHVQSFVQSDDGKWMAEQLWGFECIGGKRYHTRRIVVVRGGVRKYCRLVYEWVE